MNYLSYTKITKVYSESEPILFFKNVSEEPINIMLSISSQNPVDCIIAIADSAIGSGSVNDAIVGEQEGVSTVINILKTEGRQNLIRHSIMNIYSFPYELPPDKGILVLTQSTDRNTIINTNVIW